MSVKVELSGEIPVLTYARADSHQATMPEPPRDTIVPVNGFIDWSKSVTAHPSVLTVTRKWTVLVILSLLVGYITTVIDLASVWMNDLKKGYCFSKIDKWSLLSPYSTCPAEDWHDWSRILFGSTGAALTFFVNLPIYTIFAVVITGAACFVTYRAPQIKLSGILEIKVIILGLNYDLSQYLGLRTLFYKITGLILVVSSGLWLGKEGPLVHVACCILNIVYNYVFQVGDIDGDSANSFLRRELLSAAASTGISVAFNAPIGGVLFMVESAQSFYMPTKIMWNSFVSATIAVVVLTSFKIFTDGENFLERDLFQVEFGNFSWVFIEFVPYTLLGALGGVYGYLFIKLNTLYRVKGIRISVQRRLCQLFRVDLHKYGNYLEVFLLLAVTIILNFPMEITRLPLHAYVKILFTDCPEPKDDDTTSQSTTFICNSSNGMSILKLFYIFVQGFLLSTYTYGVHLPGGVLMPSLALGATAGRLVGLISQSIQDLLHIGSLAECTKKTCLVSPSSYAVVGAASFMSGITKLTMCVVVIIFELTGAVSYVLPIMCAVMVLKFVNDWICTDNIYDTWLKYEFNRGAGQLVSSKINEGKGSGLCEFTNATSTVKNLLPDVTTLRIQIPLERTRCIQLIQKYTREEIEDFIHSDTHEGYPLIGSIRNPVSLGYISKEVLQRLIQAITTPLNPFRFSISEKLPTSVISDELHYFQQFEDIQVCFLDTVEKSHFYISELTPLISLLEMFEKLHLNHCIVMRAGSGSGSDSMAGTDPLMTGFVDRFVLAQLINLKFSTLKDELVGRTDDVEQRLTDYERDGHSLEFIT